VTRILRIASPALLDENYEPVAPKEPTPADGVNVVEEPSVADPTLVTDPIPVTDPAPVESLPEWTESEAL